MSRWPAIVVIGALVGVGIVAGAPDPEPAPSRTVDGARLLPVATPDDALGSTWFCAAQSAGADTDADGTLVVTNAGDATASGSVALVTDTGETEDLDLTVAAQSTERIVLADHIEAEWVAATVELDRGSIAVEHEIVGSAGRAVAPCHARASARWHLPSGATTRDARLLLAVYNPFPDLATVDMTFATEAGDRQPNDLQGLPVPPRSLLVVDVTPIVTIRSVVATTVTTRRGRVVVDRIQGYDGRGASTTEEDAAEESYRPKGLTLTPGVPVAAPVWVFPAGVRSPGVHETVSVYNPGTRDAEVEIEIDLDDPRRNGRLDPIPLVVPAGEVGVLEVDDAEAVPEGVTHSITVRSVEGVPVVAERRIVAAGPDVTYIDVATSTGSPVGAPTWVVATGPRDAEVELGRVVVVNPTDVAVEVRTLAIGDGERTSVPGGELRLPAGARAEIDLADLDRPGASIVVEASGPVVVERRLISRPEGDDEQAIGASAALGVPLDDGLLILAP